MNLKNFFIFLLLFIVLFSFVLDYFVYAENDAEVSLNITSPVALLMECETGMVLYEKRAYEKMYPASTTKIMTAILTIENCNLDDITTASFNAIMSIPSDYTNADIKIGEELTIRDLLYAFMVHSANDCGYVLAEHIAGSVSNFADMMNEKAIEIGCTGTHFTNPSGIHNENHFSTAYDLALIGRYAMKNEIFRNIVSTTSFTLPATNKYEKADRTFGNSNFLIRESKTKYYYEYATGIKDGFTDASRDCLVSSAKKDGVEYIAVILYAGYNKETWLKEKYIDSVTLFDFAFSNYTTKTLGLQGDIIDKIKISGASNDNNMLDVKLQDNIVAFLPNSQLEENFEPCIELNENLNAPISYGDIIGSISYTVNNITYSSNLIAGNTVKNFNIFPVILKILLFIFILFFIYKSIRFYIYTKNKHRNYRKKGKKKYRSFV